MSHAAYFFPSSLARVEVVLNSVKVRDERWKTKSDIFGVIYVNLDAVVRGRDCEEIFRFS